MEEEVKIICVLTATKVHERPVEHALECAICADYTLLPVVQRVDQPKVVNRRRTVLPSLKSSDYARSDQYKVEQCGREMRQSPSDPSPALGPYVMYFPGTK